MHICPSEIHNSTEVGLWWEIAKSDHQEIKQSSWCHDLYGALRGFVWVCVCMRERGGGVGEWCAWDMGCECVVLSKDESVFAWLCKTWRLYTWTELRIECLGLKLYFWTCEYMVIGVLLYPRKYQIQRLSCNEYPVM